MSTSWYKLEDDNEKRFIKSGTEMRLLNIQLTDNGFYECLADNGVDKPLKKMFRIEVNGMQNAYVARFRWSLRR